MPSSASSGPHGAAHVASPARSALIWRDRRRSSESSVSTSSNSLSAGVTARRAPPALTSPDARAAGIGGHRRPRPEHRPRVGVSLGIAAGAAANRRPSVVRSAVAVPLQLRWRQDALDEVGDPRSSAASWRGSARGPRPARSSSSGGSCMTSPGVSSGRAVSCRLTP